MDIKKDLNDLTDALTVVDLFATWCGPCRMLAPILEDIKENNVCEVFKIDVDASPDVARKYNVFSIPTLLLFKNKTLVSTSVGYKSYDELVEWINNNK